MRFSQRHGYTPIKETIQLKSIDEETRNALWNALNLHYWSTIQWDDDFLQKSLRLSYHGNLHLHLLCRSIWMFFFKKPIDTMPDGWNEICKHLRGFFFKCKWYEVYDLVEFIAKEYPIEITNSKFQRDANSFLESEVAGYRFVDGHIIEITAEEEMEAVEGAVASAKAGPVREHLGRAIELLSDRRAPDYRNSIKESISAVEALVKVTCGAEKGTLGELLKELGRRHPVHPALEAAFGKLYGYTSDAKGIRHALMEEDSATFEEAKFMLVVCSAFVNYVRGGLKA
ncbi:MAG: hypothetical protein P4L42_13435 [Desulfocapsaceae bacterium]|nr:hypothetical protein [Desulfocapsaceae bacterium]